MEKDYDLYRIKRLGERGVLKNDNGTVSSLVSKDEAQACEIDELLEKKFEGSLPALSLRYETSGYVRR